MRRKAIITHKTRKKQKPSIYSTTQLQILKMKKKKENCRNFTEKCIKDTFKNTFIFLVFHNVKSTCTQN